MILQRLFCALCFQLLFSCETKPQQAGFTTLTDHKGTVSRAYVTGPENAPLGILVVHDYFGISAATLQSAERLAHMGYRVVAVDLYGGKSASKGDSAELLVKGKDSVTVRAILETAVSYLERPGRKLASVGFSAGGIDALRANLVNPSVFIGTVIVYGGSYDHLSQEQLSSLRSPILAITGALDQWALTSALQFMEHQKSRLLELHVFPMVDHGYAQPLFLDGRNINEEATEATWNLIENFLSRKLKK